MAKSLAVLTSGGDAPGMNAAVRAVVRAGIYNGFKVYGVYKGYNGLLNHDINEMNLRSVSDILSRGGTILYTARSKKFMQLEYQQQAADYCRSLDIEGLVVIGGDGSFRGAGDLSSLGIPCIGIPGTIDNDIQCTEYTIGYDTAMNTAVDMIDKLRDTTQSHDRCSVVEVMGRRAGYIAVNVALAVGAEAAITLERPYDLNEIADRMKKTTSEKNGKHHFIIVVAEGVGHSEEIAKKLEELTGIEARATVLGHVQRGGAPTIHDRVVATEMGYRAVELLEQGIGNRIIGVKDGQIYDIDIQEGLAMKKNFLDRRYDILVNTAY